MNGSTIKERYNALTLYYLFEIIHKNFMVKSTGGTDDLGNKWEPLSKNTKIYKPLARGESSAFKVRSYRNSKGLLTPKQNKLWSSIYRRSLSQGKSPATAAQLAWGYVKSKGAKTKKDVLKYRNPPILITTARLERSLRPGRVVGTTYRKRPEQIAKVEGGVVIVGTEVPYSEDVAQLRPPIPEFIQPWIDRANQKAVDKLRQEMKK